MDPTYPILTRWPAAEDMPDGSVWAWSSCGWTPPHLLPSVTTVSMVALGGCLGFVELPGKFVWNQSDWGDGDTIQRIR